MTKPIDYAGPTGRELPGEHWNARIIREQRQASLQPDGSVHPAEMHDGR